MIEYLSIDLHCSDMPHGIPCAIETVIQWNSMRSFLNQNEPEIKSSYSFGANH